jgi:hypothetical protein
LVFVKNLENQITSHNAEGFLWRFFKIIEMKGFEVTGTDGSSKRQITTSSGTGKNSIFS